MLTPDEIDEWFLPDWASGVANGDYTKPNASLPTRDGRKTGNAVMVGLSDKQWPNAPITYVIATDAGNILRVNLNELRELFHPPVYVMTNLLSTHVEALEKDTTNG